MPEQQLAASIPGRLRLAPWPRRMVWPLACVLPLCSIPAAAFAHGAPAALRACAAEPDSAKRLACYDREMGRLPAAPQQAAGASKPDLAATPAPAPTPSAAPAPARVPTPAQPQGSASAQVADSAPAQASTSAPAPQAAPPHGVSSWKKIFSGGPAWHLTARVAMLDRSPGAMVLHLDNGQVWRQIGRASGDLTLHEGDSVTIERHLGSYWLSSRYVSNMQVRLDQQTPQ